MPNDGYGLDIFVYLSAYIGYTYKFASFVFMDLCRRAPTNFCVCPFDIEILLAQLHVAAGGATAEEIRSKLKYSCTAKKEVRTHFHGMIKNLNLLRSYMENGTKKFYFQENLDVKKEFVEEADSYFEIGSKRVNFRKEGIAERINAELQKEVFAHNKNLQTVRPSTLNKSTRFLVVSACFYQIEWKKQFTSRALKRFYPAEGKPINTMTMRSRSFYRFYQSEELDAKLLKLDLKKRGTSIIIVRPNLSSTVDDITAKFDALLDIEFSSFEDRLVDVELPTFTLEVSLDFKAILDAFGMRRMFIAGEAELDEIVNEEEDFMVDAFTQKIVLQMDQSVNMSKNSGTSGSSGKFPPPEAIMFKVDRPFVFLIKDNNMVIVAGKIMHPNITYHIIGNSYERVIQTDKKNPPSNSSSTSKDKKDSPSNSMNTPSTSKDQKNPPSNSINTASTSKIKTLLPRKSMNGPSTSKDKKDTPSNSINSASTSKIKTLLPRNSTNTPSTSKDKKIPPSNSINSASISKINKIPLRSNMNTPSTSKDKKNPSSSTINPPTTSKDEKIPPSNSINSASASKINKISLRSSMNAPITSKDKKILSTNSINSASTSTIKKNPPRSSINTPSTSKDKKDTPSNSINPASTSKIKTLLPRNSTNTPSTCKDKKNPPSSSINPLSTSKDEKNLPSSSINSASASKIKKNPPKSSINSASSSKDKKIPPSTSKDKKGKKGK